MGIQLPPELADVAAQAGVHWPEADEDRLRQQAQAWRDAGTKLTTLTRDADHSASNTLHAVSGNTGDAARRHWSTFVAPDTGHLTAAAHGCHAAADRLDHAAHQVGSAKVEIVRNLVNLAKNSDAAHQAASAGHPNALLGLDTAVRATNANVTNITNNLAAAVVPGNGVDINTVQPVVNPNPGHHGPLGTVTNVVADTAQGVTGTVQDLAPVVADPGRLPDALPQPIGDTGPGHPDTTGPVRIPPTDTGPGLANLPADAPTPPTGIPAHPANPAVPGQTVQAGLAGPLLDPSAPAQVPPGAVAAPGGGSPGSAAPGQGLGIGGGPIAGGGPTPSGGPGIGGSAAPGQPRPGGPAPGSGLGVGGPAVPGQGRPGGAAPGSGLGVGGPAAPGQPRPGGPAVSGAPGASGPAAPGPARPGGAGSGGGLGGSPVADSARPGGGAGAGGSPAPGQGRPGAPGEPTGSPRPGGGASPGAPGRPGPPAMPLPPDPDVARSRGPAVGAVPVGPQGTPPPPAAAIPREQRDDPAFLFWVHMFPIGHMPVKSERPARQLPPPPAEVDFAPGLRFSPGDHPRHDEIQAVPASLVPVPHNESLPVEHPAVGELAEGYDPLGGQHERDWDRRYLVRLGSVTPQGVSSAGREYAWPPGESYPEGGTAEGEPEVLAEGTVIDRFGSPRGRVFSAEGTVFARRSLPPEHLAAGYRRYRVLRELPVWRAVSAPWFGQPGGGERYRATYSAIELVALGYLEDLT